jgi:hypothetical protein
MTKPFFALLFLGLAVQVGCSGEDAPEPNPLANKAGFCTEWGRAACQQTVVSACNAASVEDCVASQRAFCESVVPRTYTSTKAEACIAAVKAAYADADLTAEELQVVRHLTPPCDQLSKGLLAEGDECAEDEECDTAAGLHCVRKQEAVLGSCEIPVEVAAGDFCDEPSQVCDTDHYCNGENCVSFKKTNGACSADYECKPVDHCAIEADADQGKCTPRLELNEACSADEDCQSGYCVTKSGETEGECASMIRLSRSEPLCDDLQ